ncbi:MAG: FAD-dependent oxidoreductase [Tepidisphaeraceae bacterium]
MNGLHVQYLIIGGGLAGSSAAQAIRKLDPRGELMMVGQENVRPYHRPPLSKNYLRNRRERKEVFVQPVGWFTENGIRLRTATRASHLDTARRIVSLDNGEEVSFDRLLLATGISPAHLTIPGSDFPNIYYLRTLEDADRLHHAIDKAKAEGLKHNRGTPAVPGVGAPSGGASAGSGRGRVAVIGGGVLGVELAATLTQIGLGVDLMLSQATPWPRFAGEHTGRFLTRYLENHDVVVHASARPQQLDGDGRVQRVVIDAERTVACDFVVAAVGATLNRDLLRGTPITAEKAILVDDHCRTNVEGIFAAGDCAAVFDPLFGKHRVLDHWDNAAVTGALAGANMAGGDLAYDAVNHFFSDVFDLTLLGWGEARQVDRRLIRGNTTIESPDFLELGIASDGRIAQVLAINHTGEDELLRDLVARRVRVDGQEEALKDPAFPLASLL